MKLSLGVAKQLLHMQQSGETVSKSSLKGKIVDELAERGILIYRGKGRGGIYELRNEYLPSYLKNRLQINDLETYIQALEGESDRAQNTMVSADSKLTAGTVAEGFMIKVTEPLQVQMNGEALTVRPQAGLSQFVHQPSSLLLDEEVVIVGVENVESFTQIERQQHYFAGKKCLFVSRYFSHTKSFQKWLQTINNPYLHFGDFDLAGAAIYLHEIKPWLKPGQGSYFMPKHLQELFEKYGNPKRYYEQLNRFSAEKLMQHEEIAELVKLIREFKAGVDQEVLIGG
jgi:hypothetical protein